MNVLVTPPILIFISVPSNQMSPLTGEVGAVPLGILNDALAVVDAPRIVIPLATSIALQSAAAVSVGLMCKPLVIPVAVPVWLIAPVTLNEAKSAVPLDCDHDASDKNTERSPLATAGADCPPAP